MYYTIIFLIISENCIHVSIVKMAVPDDNELEGSINS